MKKKRKIQKVKIQNCKGPTIFFAMINNFDVNYLNIVKKAGKSIGKIEECWKKFRGPMCRKKVI